METLEKIVGSNPHLKVILLFCNNGGYFTNLTRLAKRLDKSHVTVRKVVSDLVDAGILKEAGIGNTRVIKINENGPYTEALFNFINSINGIKKRSERGILVVEDESIIAMNLEERLMEMGYTVVGRASSGEEAIEKAREFRPDLILMDIVMPGEKDGIDASGEIKSEMDVPIIFLTAYADEKFVERAKRVEPVGYIVKPYEERELRAAIEIALYKKREAAG